MILVTGRQRQDGTGGNRVALKTGREGWSNQKKEKAEAATFISGHLFFHQGLGTETTQ